MSIKLQINSLEALERLIGGDSEIEMQIRGTIIQEFSKKHLKGIIDKKYEKAFDKELNEFLYNKSDHWHNRVKPEFREIFQEHIIGTIKEFMTNAVKEEIKKYLDSKESIKKYVQEQLENYLQRAIYLQVEGIVSKEYTTSYKNKLKKKTDNMFSEFIKNMEGKN